MECTMDSTCKANYEFNYTCQPRPICLSNTYYIDDESGEVLKSYVYVLRKEGNPPSGKVKKSFCRKNEDLSSGFVSDEGSRSLTKTNRPESEDAIGETRRKQIIPIWKEYILGPEVYDKSLNDMSELNLRERNHLLLIYLYNKFFYWLPAAIVRVFLVLIVTLYIMLPCISIDIMYYQRLFVHMKIHKVAEERNIDPVFTGNATQGPIIFCLRKLTCPYCRQREASRLALKYHSSLSAERTGST